MTARCQQCGHDLGPEPRYDRPIGWYRTLCTSCTIAANLIAPQHDADDLDDDDEDDD